MFFLLPLVGAAVGAAVGTLVTYAAGENDRQAAEHHRKVANDLSAKYSDFEKRYNEYSDKSKKQIDDLTQQCALDEAEKDLLHLAIRLQQSLYTLMWNIDEKPTSEGLRDFSVAVECTNKVLTALNEELICIPNKYFTRNFTRIKKREKLAKPKSKKRS